MDSVPAVSDKGIIFGLQQAQENLRQLGGTISQSAVRKGLYAGAVVLRDEARRLVQVRTGALKRAIVAVTDRKKGVSKGERVAATARVRIDKKAFAFKLNKTGKIKLRGAAKTDGTKGLIYPRNYAHIVEYGARAHYLGSRGGGKMHPGARPKPFLRPAWSRKLGAAQAVFAEVVYATMVKETAKRAARKTGR